MSISKSLLRAFTVAGMIVGMIAISPAFVFSFALATDTPTVTQQQELAANVPMFLQLEITSSCTDNGAIFKIVNRGKKWPRMGILHLYRTDDKSAMAEHKIRLAPNQKVSFVIKKEKIMGRPVGMWIEPQWYKREFTYDATTAC